MTLRIGLASLFLLVVLGVPTILHAQPSNVELQFGRKAFSPTGTIRHDGSSSGSNVNVESDLGLETEQAFTGGFHIQTEGAQGYRLSYTTITFEGSRSPDDSFTFKDETFTTSDTVKSDLQYQLLSFDMEWRVTRPHRRDFFNIVFGGRAVEFKGTLKNSAGTKKKNSSFQTGVPVAGVNFRQYLAPRIYLGGRWQGVEGTFINNQMQYLDAEISAAIGISRDFWIMGSYHDLRIDGNNYDAKFDLNFEGPEVNALVYF